MMKRVVVTLIAVLLSMAAAARTMEVFLNIPGMKPVHSLDSDVEWDSKTLMVTIRMPSFDSLRTQKVCVDEGTVEKSVSNRTVSSENVSRLPALLLNESLSVQAVSIATTANREKKSRLTIHR